MLWDFSKQESTSVYLKVFAMKGQFLLLLLLVGFTSNPSWINTSMKLMPNVTHHVNLTTIQLLYTLLSEERPLITHLAVTAMSNCYTSFWMLTLNFLQLPQCRQVTSSWQSDITPWETLLCIHCLILSSSYPEEVGKLGLCGPFEPDKETVA